MTRSYYPDSLVESYVKYLMKYMESQEYPEVSKEQAVYALTVAAPRWGDYTMGSFSFNPYDVAYALVTLATSEEERYDPVTREETEFTKQGVRK